MPATRFGFLTLLILGMLTALPGAAAPDVVFPVPINVAEAVIEPFWDGALSGLPHWRIDDGSGHGLKVSQGWCNADFEWADKPASGSALRMTRTVRVNCGDYDVLLVRAAPPGNAVLEISVTTDKGPRSHRFAPHKGAEEEYALKLDGAGVIESITLAIEAGDSGPGVGWFRWIALQNSAKLAEYYRRWDYSGMTWDTYIQPGDFEPAFKPLHGIFVNEEELTALREEHAKAVADSGTSSFMTTAEAAKEMHFEVGITEFARSEGRHERHNRVRDSKRPSFPGNRNIALAGQVLKDPETLRAAARYALSLAMCEHWREGFIGHFPGGSWEHRGFRPSSIAEEVAYVLDVAGEILTGAGRTFLLRRLAEEGCGDINYVMWRYEYIYHCNQVGYFNPGRMCAYLVMEREWPRVKPYTDLALKDSIENLENALLPDGGCGEGPSYFVPTVRGNYKVLKYYARARGLDVATLVPPVLRKSSDFAALLMSTTDADVIPICDGSDSFSQEVVDILVDLIPGSTWSTLNNKKRRVAGLDAVTPAGPPLPAFVQLPHMGPLASVRQLGDKAVKLLVMGHANGSGHTHEDKGSFVLEYAGETFALDLGTCNYGDPIHHQYSHCERHNMLVPTGLGDRPHPQCPLLTDVKPTGTGDTTTFEARIDATPGWDGLYKKWARTWDSPTPDTLTIHDSYELASGSGVAFYWQTQLPVTIDGLTATIQGKNGRVVLTAPAGCTIRLETLPLVNRGSHRRIAISKEGTAGELGVKVRLQE